MTAVTLLDKAYGSFSQQRFETMLSLMCKDLRAEIRVKDKTVRDWIQIDVAGEDESVALKLLEREIGLAPVSADAIGKFSELRGKIIGSDKSMIELRVDVGVFEPRIYDAVVPLQRLQAQLVDGRSLSLQRIIQLFCLVNFMPVHIKIIGDLNSVEDFWQAELSELQLSQFSEWLKSNLDRLIVLGASVKEVEVAVERSRHFRDVLRIEPLGFYEHAVLCKLGTDAVGLMPKLGPYLRHAFLAPFSPRKIKKEIKREEF